MTTPNLSLPELAASQSQPHVTVNAALRRIDAAVNLSVLAISGTPPGSPADGDRYIVAVGATGAWAGEDHHIAAYIGTAWKFLIPEDGWLAFNRDDGQFWVFYALGSPAPAWALLSLGAETLDELMDVDTTGATSGDVLAFDGSAWVPSTPSGGGGSGGGGDVTPDNPPASPHAMDDEFDDNTIDAKWTASSTYSQGSIISAAETQGALVIVINAGTNDKAYTQPISGSAWKIRAKVRMTDLSSMDGFGSWNRIGIFAARSADTKRVSGLYQFSTGASFAGADFRRTTGNTYNSDTGVSAQIVTPEMLASYGAYLELEYDGTDFFFRVSASGHEGSFCLAYTESATAHLGGAPDLVGIEASPSSGSAVNAAYIFDWFRRIS